MKNRLFGSELSGKIAMNIPELFIRRPVMTTLVMLGILLFGIISYRLLPVSDLPNVDFPTILVTASFPGASPETMASAVATPLGTTVFHDRWHRFDEFHEFAGKHPDHPPV